MMKEAPASLEAGASFVLRRSGTAMTYVMTCCGSHGAASD